MKKILKVILIAVIAFIGAIAISSGSAEAADVSIGTKNASSGVVTIEYGKSFTVGVKAIVKKGDTQYTYTITDKSTSVPLQMGDGKYTISVHENISGTTYNTVSSTTVSVSGLKDETVYTNSIQIANYSDNKTLIKEINKMLDGVTVTEDEVKTIYDYVVKNYSYDKNKASTVSSGYVPELQEFVDAKKGICYDYASLFAAVLRSNGIPTKLVMGYSNTASTYHAWSQVLLDGSWVTIDTTYDAQLVKAGGTATMEKDSSKFQESKVY